MTNLKVLPDALSLAARTEKGIGFIEARDEEKLLSYKDLQQTALEKLGFLQQHGVTAGDELILLLKDNQTFIEIFWACLVGGIIPVPVAVGISDEHRAKVFRIFEKLERANLFTDSGNLERLASYASAHNESESYQQLKNKTCLSEESHQPGHQGNPHMVQAEDTAFIQFSSGSTSDPKGVVLTHANILANIAGIIEAGKFSPEDISLSWMPLTHDMGLIGFHLNMLVAQIDQFLMPTELFSRRPLLWLQKASEKKASILCSPNFGYKHYLKALGEKNQADLDLQSIRLIYNGAEPISISLCNEFMQRLAKYGLKKESMYTVYGLAEASLAVSFPEAGEPFRTLYVNRHQLGLGEKVNLISESDADAMGFVIEGKAVPGCEIRIADEDNQPLEEMAIGAIHIRGPNVTQGYYNDEKSNATALTGDGWVDTGDLGFVLKDELIVTGRRKDIIFAHGQNYYPHDLEALLIQAGLELGKVVVFGVRQSSDDEDELLVFVLYRQDLAGFADIVQRVSHVINEQTGLEVNHVIPVKRIPKTTSGKIQRRLLAEDFLRGEYAEEINALRQLHDQKQAEVDGDLSTMEGQLKTIVDTVVTDKNLGVHENFFDAGISSLALAEIHQRIDDQWPGQVDVVDLFEYQTVAEVATFLENKLK